MQRSTATLFSGNTPALDPSDRLGRFAFQIATITDGAIAWGRPTGTRAAAAVSDPDLGDRLVLRPGQEWASAEQLARRFDMSLKWIHKHRAELGGRRISPDAANSKWKFHVPTADAWMSAGLAAPKRPTKRRPHAVGDRTVAGSARREFRR